MKILLTQVSFDYRTFSGGNVLINAVDNEDSDPDVVRIVLENEVIIQQKNSLSSTTEKAQHSSGKYYILQRINRTGLSKSGLMYAIHFRKTALNFAVMRGDVEIVKISLRTVLIRTSKRLTECV